MTLRYPSLRLAVLTAVFCLVTAHADELASSEAVATLADLEARSPKDWNPRLIAENNASVIALVESNRLVTGSDFYRAAVLLGCDLGEYRIGRMHYELLLASLSKDYADAESALPLAWDFLLNKLGRPIRIDTANLTSANPDFFDADPAPACIRAVWSNPSAARAALAQARDNPEIKALVDADQADRKVNFTTHTADDRMALVVRDRQRNVRLRQIVAAGDLHTAADFENAALVMQHSTKPAGIQLAHELAVCSLLLGDRAQGRWLVAASYDRFLHQIGHDQRFGTQFGALGLDRLDAVGICDTERQALGCRPLADSQKLRPSSDSRP